VERQRACVVAKECIYLIGILQRTCKGVATVIFAKVRKIVGLALKTFLERKQ